MQKIILVLFFLTISLKSYSQLDVVGSFNAVDIGRNVMLSLKKDVRQHSLLVGLKYNINMVIHDNQNNVFRKRFYATNSAEHFGLDLGYQYYFSLLSD